MGRLLAALSALLLVSSSSVASNVSLASNANVTAADNGWSFEQKRNAKWHLDQHRRLSAAMTALAPQRPGIVDVYIVAIGLDSDPVFGREATEAGKVLARRYGGAGRTLTLVTGADGHQSPQGSPANLAIALAAVAAKMNVSEDVLILYATSHGAADVGLVYRDGEAGYGFISPNRLASLLTDLGIRRRMLLVSACFSGVFIPPLSSETSVIVTAASDMRTSFGCVAANDWTYFGDAMINTALRKTQSFDNAVSESLILINQWESERGLTSSQPQIFVGASAKDWLSIIEKRVPAVATAKVGRPAIADDPVTAAR